MEWIIVLVGMLLYGAIAVGIGRRLERQIRLGSRLPLPLLTLAALLVAGAAEAASLKICYTDAGTDTVRVEALYGGVALYGDLMPTAVTVAGVTCSTNVIPAGLVRGVAQPVTLRGYNAFGEGGGTSNPITFRAPLIPAILTGVTVQGVTGP
jgi:hypothetical protein